MPCTGTPPPCPPGNVPNCTGNTWGCMPQPGGPPPGPQPGPGGHPPDCPPGSQRQWDPVGRTWTCRPDQVTTPTTPPAPSDMGGGGGCPPGQEMSHGGHPGNPLRCRPAAGGGGPTTNSGGGGKAAAATALPGSDVEKQIWEHINDLLSGKTDPFSDERVRQMKGQAFQAGKGQEKNRLRALDEDLIGTGLYRSGVRARGRDDIRRDTSATYTGQVTGILMQQEVARYQARLDGLDRARNWLNDQRNYLLAKEDNEIKRQVGMAQIQLGYARIAAEERMLQAQLSKMGGGGGGGMSSIGGIPIDVLQTWQRILESLGGK